MRLISGSDDRRQVEIVATCTIEHMAKQMRYRRLRCFIVSWGIGTAFGGEVGPLKVPEMARRRLTIHGLGCQRAIRIWVVLNSGSWKGRNIKIVGSRYPSSSDGSSAFAYGADTLRDAGDQYSGWDDSLI
jgi:hypothetical protein